METNNKRAVIFARVSSVSDRQDTTRQITDLTRFANANDMEIVNIYQEHISGGKKNEERRKEEGEMETDSVVILRAKGVLFFFASRRRHTR